MRISRIASFGGIWPPLKTVDEDLPAVGTCARSGHRLKSGGQLVGVVR